MTRFTERVERDLGQIADRATPSSTAWEAIRHRIDEQDTSEPTMEVIMLDPNRTHPPARSRTWMAVAAAIAALALIGGLIVAGTRAADDPIPADEPTPTLPEVGEGSAEPEADAATVAPLPFAGADVEPGRYVTDLLGLSVTFDVPETTTLWTARPNRVLLTDAPTFVSPYPVTSRTLSFTRISGWNTPEEAVDPNYFGPGSIDADDIDAWAAANDVTASIPPCCRTVALGDEAPERVPLRVAGRETTPLDVQLQPAETNQTFYCDEGQSCVWAASLSERGTISRFDNEPLLSTGQVNRLWVITIDGEVPLLVHASAADGDEEWLDLVENTTLATLEIGPDAPPVGSGQSETAVPESEIADMAVIGVDEADGLVIRAEPDDNAEVVSTISAFESAVGISMTDQQQTDDVLWVRVVRVASEVVDGWVPSTNIAEIEPEPLTPSLYPFISSVRSALGGPDPAAALAELASDIRVSTDVSFSEDDRLITASELASGAVGDVVAEFAASTSLQETERVSVDRRIRANTGGTIENIVEFFPGAAVLELHYSGDEGNRPATWTSTLLVIEPLEGGSDGSTWQLVGIAQDGPAS